MLFLVVPLLLIGEYIFHLLHTSFSADSYRWSPDLKVPTTAESISVMAGEASSLLVLIGVLLVVVLLLASTGQQEDHRPLLFPHNLPWGYHLFKPNFLLSLTWMSDCSRRACRETVIQATSSFDNSADVSSLLTVLALVASGNCVLGDTSASI